VLISINNEIYLKTGDLARYNVRGELVHVGRVDFQIKVRGQRVETTEIEETIINCCPEKIFNSLVTKIPQMDDVLVAYVISNDSDLDTEEIRSYCNKYLRQYMVPSHFVVLDKFPLNSNGKIDRKNLPLPKSLYHTPLDFLPIEDQSMSELEKRVHNLWCSGLRLEKISCDTNCFTLGGSSLSIMQFFNYYQFYLVPEKQIYILDFFVNPTIANHVQLLIKSKPKTQILWNPLHLVQGMSSLLNKLMLKYLILYRCSFVCSATSLDG
jgi:hypothetical protein